MHRFGTLSPDRPLSFVDFTTVDNRVGLGGTALGSCSVPNRIFAHERSELIKCII